MESREVFETMADRVQGFEGSLRDFERAKVERQVWHFLAENADCFETSGRQIIPIPSRRCNDVLQALFSEVARTDHAKKILEDRGIHPPQGGELPGVPDHLQVVVRKKPVLDIPSTSASLRPLAVEAPRLMIAPPTLRHSIMVPQIPVQKISPPRLLSANVLKKPISMEQHVRQQRVAPQSALVKKPTLPKHLQEVVLKKDSVQRPVAPKPVPKSAPTKIPPPLPTQKPSAAPQAPNMAVNQTKEPPKRAQIVVPPPKPPEKKDSKMMWWLAGGAALMAGAYWWTMEK